MEVCRNTTERNHRFLEEALELVQAMGCTAAEAHMLVDYTFGRPVGDPEQEVGGALVTLAALCSAADISMAELGERELARCWQNIDRIRFKQAGKPRSSPLPGPSPVETQPVASNPDHERWLAETWKMIETCATDIRSSNVTLSPEGCRALLGERNAHETDGWQPIETAPLEGAHVLVVDDEQVSEARHIEGHGWYLAQNDPTDSWGPGPLNPTHWMPLPCPPGTRSPPSSPEEPSA